MLNRLLLAGLIALLSACGGGGSASDLPPVVSEIKAQQLQYGQKAVINIAGQNLRNDMIVDAGTCTKPSFASTSSPNLAVLNCQVTATGPITLTIKAANGTQLFTTTLTVLPPQVTLITSQGIIVVELNPTVVPVTVNNFLSYVSSGYYNSTLFHRVIPGFVIQGGGYTTGPTAKAGQLAPIVLESNKGLSNTRGTLGMARTSTPDSATSEFFINLVDNVSLDYQSATNPGYAVFGTVVQGMDVVDAIALLPTGTANGLSNVPTADVTIQYALQSQ